MSSNLLRTLAKVAVGVAAAKGIGNMMSQKAAASEGSVGGPGSAQADTAGAQPGLGDPPNSVLGGKGQAGGAALAAFSNSSLRPPPVRVLVPVLARQRRRRAGVSTR